MTANEIINRLNYLDAILDRYDRANVNSGIGYNAAMEEYAELSDKLAEMNIKRPLW